MAKKSMAPGGGGQFQKLEGKLAAKPGIKNPAGLAAKIGREEYGKDKFQKMAARGKERATAERKGEKKPPLLPAKPKAPAEDGLAKTITAAAKLRG